MTCLLNTKGMRVGNWVSYELVKSLVLEFLFVVCTVFHMTLHRL